MAILAIDGFDLYNGPGVNTGARSKWTIANTSGFTMESGRFGGQCLQVQANGAIVSGQKSITASGSVSVGVAFRLTSMPTESTATVRGMIFFNSAGSGQCGIRVNANGAVEAFRYSNATGTAGTSLGISANGVIQVNTWHYVEVEIVISDTVGRITVYVDGAQVLNLTNQDTKNATASTVDTLLLGAYGNNGIQQYDDLYCIDSATRLGERRVETIYPTSDVAQGFARSTGSTNYTLVDEATVNGDTDYVQGSTVGDVDTYGLGNLSSTPSAIDAVQVTSFALKTDAGSRSIALQVKSGGTTSDGSNLSLTTSYSKLERLLTTDPDTGSAWTASGVNALQAGPKVTI